MAVSLLVLGSALALTGSSFSPKESRADLGDTVPSWSNDVRPILGEHCFACHGPDPGDRAAGLRLDTGEGILASDVLDLATPSESELLYRVTTEEAFDHMPPLEVGRALTEDEVDVLRRWIESGAEWEPHWAYAPLAPDFPRRVEAVDIDELVEAKLAESGRVIGPAAEPRQLLRRLHFDVVGLPPSAALVAAFEEDPSEAAYAAHVDRLLGSVQFGEHWARHWLDLARYADSHGYTIDGGRTIWPWRDWVVRAIADDMPFDRFTVEQLAGDLLSEPTRDQLIATGFHRNTQVNQEGGAKDEENRINAVLDRVNTTGSVWLGSSIACAQCHTHKFDPITHTEYYGLFAFFNSTVDGGVSQEPTLLAPRSDEEESQAIRWETDLAAAERRYERAWAEAARGWTVWQPSRATGSNGPELRPEISGAYRVLGQNPVYSTYVLQGPVERLSSARSLRLEVLADGGPGRGGKNFVLQEIRVASRPLGADETAWTAHAVVRARADFEQDTSAEGGARYPASSLVTGSEEKGWAIKPEFQAPHVLEMELEEDVSLEGRELRLELAQEFGSMHTLGAFRIGLREDELAEDRDAPGAVNFGLAAWGDAWGELARVRRARPSMPRTLVMQERPTPRATRRFERGSFLDQRELVEPGVPAAMDGFRARRVSQEDSHGESQKDPLRTRLDLARWLVHPENALAHRVTVNRFWQQLFGIGLVPTENDFGLRGARPSHPELLEWLAHDFVRSGFSRRHALRQILLSRTYRAAGDGASSETSRRRLSGEVLRDSMLASSGLLADRVGGPPVQPPQPDGVFAFTQARKSWKPSEADQRFRRSLYTRIWRSSPFPFFSTFDAPSPGFTCTRRTESRSPLQALALANDPMVMEIAAGFGARLIAETEEEVADLRLTKIVQSAYRDAIGRGPTETELALLTEHASRVAVSGKDAESGLRAAATAVCRAVFNLYEFTHRP